MYQNQKIQVGARTFSRLFFTFCVCVCTCVCVYVRVHTCSLSQKQKNALLIEFLGAGWTGNPAARMGGLPSIHLGERNHQDAQNPLGAEPAWRQMLGGRREVGRESGTLGTRATPGSGRPGT